VIVNLRHSESEAIEGILWRARGSWLILRDCSALKAGRDATKIVGEVHVPRENVAFLEAQPS
jgi:hypothetical protein